MKGLCIQGVFRCMLSSICSLSFLVISTKGSAQDYYFEKNQEEKCCGWGKTALIVGSAVVAGTIAGAVTGHSSHGHHGCRGSCGADGDRGPSGPQGLQGPQGTQGTQGPEGPQGAQGATGSAGSDPFVADIGNQLVFNFEFAVLVDQASNNPSGFITPFVSTPDGTVVRGSTLSLPIDNETISIPISDLVFGSYHAGIEVICNSPNPSFELDLRIIVEASRDNSETILIDSEPVMVVTNTEQRQINVSFTYGPESDS